MKSFDEAIAEYEKRKNYRCDKCKIVLIEETTCCGTLNKKEEIVQWCLGCCPLKDDPMFADFHN